MRSKKAWRALVVVAIGAVLALAGSALAAPGGAKLLIKGQPSFRANAFLTEAFRYAPGTITVHSGATVTLTNQSVAPHSLTVVKRSQVPRTVRQIEECGFCEQTIQAHGIGGPESGPPGPPAHPVLDVGAAGVDQPGDSILIGPKGSHAQVRFKVTAKPGTTLNFLCAFHPWMQGRIKVIK